MLNGSTREAMSILPHATRRWQNRILTTFMKKV